MPIWPVNGAGVERGRVREAGVRVPGPGGGARDDQGRSSTTLGAGPGGLPRDRNTPKIETRRISDLETLGNHEP